MNVPHAFLGRWLRHLRLARLQNRRADVSEQGSTDLLQDDGGSIVTIVAAGIGGRLFLFLLCLRKGTRTAELAKDVRLEGFLPRRSPS